jgi:hypothetical protein
MIDEPRRDTVLNDPDVQNSEQEDESSQAHEVAQEALNRGDRPRESAGSEHGGHSDPTQIIPDDAQDLVDLMTSMDHSGRIDMGAFDGEEPMDDEDGSTSEES